MVGDSVVWLVTVSDAVLCHLRLSATEIVASKRRHVEDDCLSSVSGWLALC